MFDIILREPDIIDLDLAQG